MHFSWLGQQNYLLKCNIGEWITVLKNKYIRCTKHTSAHDCYNHYIGNKDY